MPQSLARVVLHLIFSTRNRQRVFLTEEMREHTTCYMAGILQNLGSSAIRIGLATDHVHVLHALSRTTSVSDLVATVKRESSEWIKQQPWARGNLDFAQFHWQRGYGVFSVSESQIQLVKDYIDQQLGHHRQVTFQEEYREFLRKHSQTFDERYVWD
jgi:REP element-mobilizing transposase RayT